MDDIEQTTASSTSRSPFRLVKILLNILCAFSLIAVLVLVWLYSQFGIDRAKDLIQLVAAVIVLALPIFARYLVQVSEARSGSTFHISLAGSMLVVFAIVLIFVPTPVLLLMAALGAWSGFLCFGLRSISSAPSKNNVNVDTQKG